MTYAVTLKMGRHKVNGNFPKQVENVKVVTELPQERKVCSNIEECCREVVQFVKRYELTEDYWEGGQVYYEQAYEGRIDTYGQFHSLETPYGKKESLDNRINKAQEWKKEIDAAERQAKQKQMQKRIEEFFKE